MGKKTATTATRERPQGSRRPAGAIGIGISLVLFVAMASAQPQPDFEKTQIKTVPVSKGIYMLIGEGGNIGVSVGEDGVLLIDDQFAPLTPKIEAAVSKLSDLPIRFVFNTHWHGDHAGGNENLGKAGALIVAHDQARARMSTDQFVEVFQSVVPALPKVALPVITFSETSTFHLNGQTIQASHVAPAHTDGDAILHFKEANVLHTGDVYFNGIYPFIDRSGGGSMDGMIAAADTLLSIASDTTKIMPGHGPLSDKAGVKAYRKMLVDVRARTQKAIDDGTSLEAFLASKPTADYDKTWGQAYPDPPLFLSMVYKSLSIDNQKR